MFESWFTSRCEALVGENGRALTGEALAAAETALNAAKQSGDKLWLDAAGNYYTKERKLFARACQLLDANGKPVRICGCIVKNKANFCSKCGAPAPGGWWRCGGCGQHIGNESKTCPHCGREQNTARRLDLSDGVWMKGEEIFAERFELEEVESLLGDGLNIQESQRALLLEGGQVVDVLGSGFYKMADLKREGEGDRSFVMVDASEFDLPMCVDHILTSDNLESELHIVLTMMFEPSLAQNFMKNLMYGNTLMHGETMTSALGYDELAHCILQNADAAVRNFCNGVTTENLFSDANLRIRLENHIGQWMKQNLDALGVVFVRLKEMDFESETFDNLRKTSGQIEEQRRMNEFRLRADELANDATRREAMSEHEMEEYVTQLAHEKGIKDELREQEMVKLQRAWRHEQEDVELAHQQDLADRRQEHELGQYVRVAEHNEQIKDLQQAAELNRIKEQQNASLESIKTEGQIQDIRLAMDRKKDDADFEHFKKMQELDNARKDAELQRQLAILKASQGMSIQSLLMAEKDADKREALLRLHEQEMQSKMTPELLLAAAAQRGNAAAAEAIGRMSDVQRSAIERSKNENRDVYEHMLQMNERMFGQALENLSKSTPGSVTNHIIK